MLELMAGLEAMVGEVAVDFSPALTLTRQKPKLVAHWRCRCGFQLFKSALTSGLGALRRLTLTGA